MLRITQKHQRDEAGSFTITAYTILLVVTVATRLFQLGNPIAHIDDEFYLYAGRSILSGDVMYVDIWDRKPLGIFLIYAACAALGEHDVLQYQVVAGLFVLATSCVILKLSNEFTGRIGSLLAATLYPILILPIGGSSGQTPVFYNLFIASAALLTFRTVSGKHGPTSVAANGAMALVGLALTIKPTVVFEGAMFGLFLTGNCYARWKSAGRALIASAGFMAAAALPTLLIFLAYWRIGHFGDLWDATILSVLQKAPVRQADRMMIISGLGLALAIPALVTAYSLFRAKADGWPAMARTFLASWCSAALVGFLAIPNFFDHYALPLMVPFCVTMAPALNGRWRTPLFLSVLIPSLLAGFIIPYYASPYRQDYDHILTTVRRNLNGGCLYVHFGPPQLYTDTGACRVTRFVFPDHLDTDVERRALPIRQEVEMDRIFREQPPQIVVTGNRIFLLRNPKSGRVLRYHLNCNYKSLGWHRIGRDLPVQIWTRRESTTPVCRPS